MNNRIYIGEIYESWYSDSKFVNKLHFKVLFDKVEIINYYNDFINNSNYKNNNKYSVELTIYEYAYERYCFDDFNGLVLYFNEAIKSSNIYDNILKCIDCNIFKYDMNGNLINTYVRPASCDYNITFWDKPLLEEECIGNYYGEFKFYMHNKKYPNIEPISKKVTYGLRLLYLRTSSSSKDDECLYAMNYNLDEMLNFAKEETLSIIDFIGEDIKDFLAEIYDITETQCNKIFTTTEINDILRRE